MRSGRCVVFLEGHQKDITGVNWSPNGLDEIIIAILIIFNFIKLIIKYLQLQRADGIGRQLGARVGHSHARVRVHDTGAHEHRVARRFRAAARQLHHLHLIRCKAQGLHSIDFFNNYRFKLFFRFSPGPVARRCLSLTHMIIRFELIF